MQIKSLLEVYFFSYIPYIIYIILINKNDIVRNSYLYRIEYHYYKETKVAS